MFTTAEAIAAITSAAEPAELFGAPASTRAAAATARSVFRRLSRLVHPDRVGDADRLRATAAFARVSELYDQWQSSGPRLFGRYRLGALHARGSVANVYCATGGDEPVVVKIPRRPAANVLSTNERAALSDIAALVAAESWLAPYFPRVVDGVVHRDTRGAERVVNVLDASTTGFVTLRDVATAFPLGLAQPDYAWMHRRLLRAVAGAHRAGWVHGAIFADNVLIHPELHGVVLAGWSFATRPGTRLAATVDARTYPPEVGAGRPVTFETDVYMAHALMLDMLGARAPAPIRAFADGCMQDNPRLRPDAADLLDEYDDLIDRLYGVRRFRPFAMPATNPSTTKGM